MTAPRTAEQKREYALKMALRDSRKRTQHKSAEAWRNEVPKRFVDFDYQRDIASKDAPISPEARRKIVQFMRDPKSWLVLHGPTGTGKTTTACAVVAEIIADHVRNGDAIPGGPPKFYSSNELMRSLSVMDRTADGKRTVAERVADVASTASFMVIDDIGAGNEGATERQERLFWDILNNRHNDPDKITVLTTNMPLLDTGNGYTSLADWLQESMWDRVSSDMDNIIFKGGSLRGGNSAW